MVYSVSPIFIVHAVHSPMMTSRPKPSLSRRLLAWHVRSDSSSPPQAQGNCARTWVPRARWTTDSSGCTEAPRDEWLSVADLNQIRRRIRQWTNVRQWHLDTHGHGLSRHCWCKPGHGIRQSSIKHALRRKVHWRWPSLNQFELESEPLVTCIGSASRCKVLGSSYHDTPHFLSRFHSVGRHCHRVECRSWQSTLRRI